ncbi:MAG: hypothetical protein MUC43_02765 [Pirellula sp.]|jgi:hypothetical protein|nr:hypothetical protein [Pirellula sp.]
MLFVAQTEVLSSRYFFGNTAWISWVVAIGIMLTVLSILSYRGSRMSIGMRVTSLAMRLLGIGLLLLCLLEPMGVEERAKPQANAFAVVVDNSQSVKEIWDVRGSDSTSDRSEEWYRKLLQDETTWARRLAEDFRLRRYVFSSGLDPIDSFEGITMNGVDSSLVRSMLALKDRYRSANVSEPSISSTVPLAGILLFTDGQSTDRSEWNSLKQMGIPIYPVVCGDIKVQKDLAISSVSLRQTDFETAPVTLTASISAAGFSAPTIEVDLWDGENKLIETKPAVFSDPQKPATVEFRFRPSAPGVQAYKLTARATKANEPTLLQNDAPISTTAREDELTLLNNQRYQVVDRGRGPFRVLYLSGRPNWEYKFLARAIAEDAEVELTALIRIAKKEPKFNFRDNRVDSANPLFSGFEDVSEEEKEQFDQPVFVRIGLTDAGQLQAGFPKDDEELFDYHAILIDDLESDFLTTEQQSMIRRFVTIRGGGLLMLGGQESMRGKGYENSILSQLLPVYGDSVSEDPADWTNNPNNQAGPEVRFELTREGWLQPFMRVADTEPKEKDRLSSMPAFQVLNKTTSIKPGASVFAQGRQEEREMPGGPDEPSDTGDLRNRNQETVPLFVVQKYGRGRTAAFLIGDWWRWAMHRQSKDPSPMFQAWRQMIRWMVNDVPRAISLTSEKVSGATKLRRVIADVKGPDFKIMDNAQVTVELESPDGSKSELVLEASAEVPGRYESIVLCEQDGVYIATATCKAEDESVLGDAQTGWTHEPMADEVRQLGEDVAFLNQVAETTGGKVISLEDLDSFASNIPSDLVPIRERKVFPLWHQSWVIAVALACLCFEWSLRRRNGLA